MGGKPIAQITGKDIQKLYDRIGTIKLKKLTTRHLQRLYKELLEEGRIHIGKTQVKGLSTTMVRSVHLMLHAALERAVKERLIPRNPTEDCIAPKPRKIEMQILPSEDMHAYLKAAKARDLLPMFYIELVSGLRKGELVALRWDNVDIQNRTISVSKQYVRNPDGSLELTRPKTENSVRLVSIPQTAVLQCCLCIQSPSVPNVLSPGPSPSSCSLR